MKIFVALIAVVLMLYACNAPKKQRFPPLIYYQAKQESVVKVVSTLPELAEFIKRSENVGGKDAVFYYGELFSKSGVEKLKLQFPEDYYNLDYIAQKHGYKSAENFGAASKGVAETFGIAILLADDPEIINRIQGGSGSGVERYKNMQRLLEYKSEYLDEYPEKNLEVVGPYLNEFLDFIEDLTDEEN